MIGARPFVVSGEALDLLVPGTIEEDSSHLKDYDYLLKWQRWRIRKKHKGNNTFLGLGLTSGFLHRYRSPHLMVISLSHGD